MAPSWTKEQIAALVDGSLPGPEADTIRRIIDTDPDARRYAHNVGQLNSVLQTAFDCSTDESGNAKLSTAILGGDQNVYYPSRWQRRSVWIPTAVAAVLALTVGLQLYLQTGDSEDDLVTALGMAPSIGPLHLALETLPSGSTSEKGVRPMTTFRDGSGRPCREFEVDGSTRQHLEMGIACRDDAGSWNVEIVAAAPIPEARPGGYTPASGPEEHPIDEMLASLAASDPLTPSEESALIENSWLFDTKESDGVSPPETWPVDNTRSTR